MIYSPDSLIAVPLRQIFCGVGRDLGAARELIVASSVSGETDYAFDVACDGGSFVDVCRCMREHAGPPATTWKEWECGDIGWYLGPSEA